MKPKIVKMKRLLESLRQYRKAKLATNHFAFSGEFDLTYYGAPVITVVDAAWIQVYQRPWDHSMESIEEASEVAEAVDGFVTIGYPVMAQGVNGEEVEIDGGFEVQVWPLFALRTHNEFVEINLSDDEE